MIRAAARRTETAPVVLDVKNLTRQFGSFEAVRGVSFQVRAGEIFGFVGPNGAGKTTTLRILATLDEPTAGDAFVNGVSVADQASLVRPLIGFMPDRPAVYDDTTVYEYLDFFARAYGLKGPARRSRVRSVMEFTQLEDLGERLVTSLSKGMKQRTALARTLLHDPAVLLLDEPADGLDPRARIELRELLLALAEQGKAILISSHILTELSELCDGCAIIEQGRLLATGSVQHLLQQVGRAQGDVRVRLATAAEQLEERLALAERYLLEQPGVSRVRVERGELRLVLEGGEEAAQALLKRLIDAGHPVCAFGLEEADLEDAFMSVTRGNVQ